MPPRRCTLLLVAAATPFFVASSCHARHDRPQAQGKKQQRHKHRRQQQQQRPDRDAERATLVDLYQSTGGPGWTVDEPWDVGRDEVDHCDWFGVSCSDEDAGRHVTEIALPESSLEGTVPIDLYAGLPSLVRLDLGSNPGLVATFETVGSAKSLLELDLSDTSTVDAAGMSDAPSLSVLDLSGTDLSVLSSSSSLWSVGVRDIFSTQTLVSLGLDHTYWGGAPLPDPGRLQLLQRLSFRGSNVGGTIPRGIGLLSSLSYLDASENDLVGTIAYEIGRLSSLETLDLSRNNLSGTMASDVVRGWVNLGRLDLSNNFVSGTIPTAFDILPNLRLLDLSENYLSGTLTSSFLGGISNKSLPVRVDLGGNAIMGYIPREIAIFENLFLDLTDNYIDGIPPTLCEKSDWMDGNVGRYGCSAILCFPGTYNSFGRQVADDEPCVPCDSALYFGTTSCVDGDGTGVGDDDAGDDLVAMEPLVPTVSPTESPSHAASLHSTEIRPPTGSNNNSNGTGVDFSPAVSSFLQIVSPASLSRTGGYDHLPSLFGGVPYGESVALNVYYVAGDLCDDPSDDVVEASRRDYYPTRPGTSGLMPLPWPPSPFILMVDRGGCTFVTKVRHAQNLGAAAVVIADNTCQCSAGDACVPKDDDEPCEIILPVMADDGTGGDISIPSVFMFKQDADAVKLLLTSNWPVVMELSYLAPLQGGFEGVTYELWTSPADPIGQAFVSSFTELAVSLSSAGASFTPNVYIYDGVEAGCRSSDGENLCYNLCTNDGRYCQADPDGDLDTGISGAQVVAESLRRICIWKLYGDDNGIGIEWWRYVSTFADVCYYDPSSGWFDDRECIKLVYEVSGITRGLVERCMDASGGLDGDVPNVLLQDAIDRAGERRVAGVPSFYVNGAVLKGRLSDENAFAAICSAFSSESRPDVCLTCSGCPGAYCAAYGMCPTDPINAPTPAPSSYSSSYFVGDDESRPCTLACMHGGTCVLDGTSSYFCDCPPGYSGYQCEYPCDLKCMNGGSCFFDGTSSYFCDCPDGYSGKLCEFVPPSDPCTLECMNGGSCLFDETSSPFCACPDGYSGEFCENPSGPCTLECMNGGSCVFEEASSYSCACPDGYSGEFCEHTVQTASNCPDGSRCLFGGMCIGGASGQGGKYYCDCSGASSSDGIPHAGLSCEYEATVICHGYVRGDADLATSFCTNGGACIDFVDPGDAHGGCACPAGYEGDRCQFLKGTSPPDWPLDDVYPSEATVCSGEGRSGTCESDGASCRAKDGSVVPCALFEGGGVCNCSTTPCRCYGDDLIEDCPDGHTCEHGGSCKEVPGSDSAFHCDCSASGKSASYSGLHCEHEATVYCTSNGTVSRNSFCVNNGRCRGTIGKEGEPHPGCDCLPEFEGEHCQFALGMAPSDWPVLEPEQCPDANVTCLNGGTCVENPLSKGDYVCDCASATAGGIPHAGLRCEHPATSLCNIEPPYTSFCANGGACMSIILQGENHAGCRCAEGFEGPFCEFTRQGEGTLSLALMSSGGKRDDGTRPFEPWKGALATVVPVVALIGFLSFLLIQRKRRETRGADGTNFARDASPAHSSTNPIREEHNSRSTDESNSGGDTSGTSREAIVAPTDVDEVAETGADPSEVLDRVKDLSILESVPSPNKHEEEKVEVETPEEGGVKTIMPSSDSDVEISLVKMPVWSL